MFGYLYYPTLAGEIYTSEKLWKGKLRRSGETKPHNELSLLCWPATDSFWYIILRCRFSYQSRRCSATAVLSTAPKCQCRAVGRCQKKRKPLTLSAPETVGRRGEVYEAGCAGLNFLGFQL